MSVNYKTNIKMKKVIFAALLAASLSGFAQEAGKKGGADKMLQKKNKK